MTRTEALAVAVAALRMLQGDTVEGDEEYEEAHNILGEWMLQRAKNEGLAAERRRQKRMERDR